MIDGHLRASRHIGLEPLQNGPLGDGRQAIGQIILTAEHEQDARRRPCRRQIDGFNLCMGVGAADHMGMGLAGGIEVVAILTPSGEQAEIFLAQDGLTNSEIHLHPLVLRFGG